MDAKTCVQACVRAATAAVARRCLTGKPANRLLARSFASCVVVVADELKPSIHFQFNLSVFARIQQQQQQQQQANSGQFAGCSCLCCMHKCGTAASFATDHRALVCRRASFSMRSRDERLSLSLSIYLSRHGGCCLTKRATGALFAGQRALRSRVEA